MSSMEMGIASCPKWYPGEDMPVSIGIIQAMMSVTTLPWTSVRRKSRPA
jgi:hypothetical protein